MHRQKKHTFLHGGIFMDCEKLGQLILQLRKEKGLTQQEIAMQLNISNKTVSKWECGKGAPDVSLWEGISAILGADILKLLQGELNPNHMDIGKIDNIRFYVCSNCGNILTSTGKANISCCGRRLSPLPAALEAVGHEISVEEMDTDYFITIKHEMSKEHYISFAAYVYDDRIWFQRLYPEQAPTFRMPVMKGGGNLYLHCIKDGLFKYSGLWKMVIKNK